MFQPIDNIIQEFREQFKRVETFNWFVIIILGFILRKGHRGVSEIISVLRLKGYLYPSLLHYFRSTAYKVSDLYGKWVEIVKQRVKLVRVGGKVLLLGDHLKISKEGQRMPGVSILHQESDNSGKAEYISGHMFGQISGVVSNGEVSRSIPLMTERQESPPRIAGTNKPDGDTLVTQMVNLAAATARSMGEACVAALDAYFAKASAFEAAATALTDSGERLLEIVTRAPRDTVGFTVPVPPSSPSPRPRPGQPPIYGDKISLYGLFDDMAEFHETTMTLYGKKTKVKYCCLDLIWKPTWKSTKSLIHFVARLPADWQVELNGADRCVLMASDLSLTPEQIITAYALRFKIETSFDECPAAR